MRGEKSFPIYFVRGSRKPILFIVSGNFGILTLGKVDWTSRNAALRYFFWMKLVYISATRLLTQSIVLDWCLNPKIFGGIRQFCSNQ